VAPDAFRIRGVSVSTKFSELDSDHQPIADERVTVEVLRRQYLLRRLLPELGGFPRRPRHSILSGRTSVMLPALLESPHG
jgi:hypothetical protein